MTNYNGIFAQPYDVSVKSEILFCKWGRLENERSELTNTTCLLPFGTATVLDL
jgi:hypothetical protein